MPISNNRPVFIPELSIVQEYTSTDGINNNIKYLVFIRIYHF